MLFHVLSASSVLVVGVVIILIVSHLLLLSDEPDEVGDMNLLCKVLDVEADVHNLFFILLPISELNEARTC